METVENTERQERMEKLLMEVVTKISNLEAAILPSVISRVAALEGREGGGAKAEGEELVKMEGEHEAEEKVEVTGNEAVSYTHLTLPTILLV